MVGVVVLQCPINCCAEIILHQREIKDDLSCPCIMEILLIVQKVYWVAPCCCFSGGADNDVLQVLFMFFWLRMYQKPC